MSNARIQFSLADESVWQAYNPQLKEGEIVTVVKSNKKVKLVQGKVGGSAYADSTVIWDQDEAEALMAQTEAAAESATSQATAAAASAVAANDSATTAANSASAAKTSETNAGTSATNAKNSETAAKNSATSASSSAATAATQAGRAADSATAAAGSATQAGTFATTATNKATAADKSATAADKSATAADKSATAAAASAVAANDSATTAANSASAAKTSETNAAGSAESAKSLVSKAAYGFLQRNTAYAVGDIAYCEQLPAGYYLECVTAGTTGNTEPTFKVGGVKVLDGSVEWNVALVASSEFAVPVGTIISFTANMVIPGYLVCDGAQISRTTYSRLFSVIGTTYGAGDGSTTFNIPHIEDNSFIEYHSVAGIKKNAGLPNITGEIVNYANRSGFVESNGSFYSKERFDTIPTIAEKVEGYTAETRTGFDASRSSAVYGSSSTVQPKSITIRAFIKY